MTFLERQMIYVPEALVTEARLKGMTNFSKFVREALKEYIDTGATSAKTSAPAAPADCIGSTKDGMQ